MQTFLMNNIKLCDDYHALNPRQRMKGAKHSRRKSLPFHRPEARRSRYGVHRNAAPSPSVPSPY